MEDDSLGTVVLDCDGRERPAAIAALVDRKLKLRVDLVLPKMGVHEPDQSVGIRARGDPVLWPIVLAIPPAIVYSAKIAGATAKVAEAALLAAAPILIEILEDFCEKHTVADGHPLPRGKTAKREVKAAGGLRKARRRT